MPHIGVEQSRIRSRVKSQHRSRSGIDRAGGAAVVLDVVRRRHVIDGRCIQNLLDALVVHEEEHLVLLDRAAEGSTELVSAERRHRRAVEKSAGVEIAVAEVLVHRTVEIVRTRFGDTDNGAAVAGILRAVSSGESLKLRYSVDAERGAGHIAAGVALPPVQHVFAIESIGVPFRARTRDRVSVGDRSQRAVSARRVSGDARRKQDQLFPVAAVQRQFAHLSLVD